MRPPRGVIAGAALAIAAIVAKPWAGASAAKPETRLVARPMRTTTASACATCHPREVAEWTRSAMAHSATSPLFGALESLIEEQVGRDAECPGGAGVLRRASSDACVAPAGITATGAGGEGWCVNCHAPLAELDGREPSWSSRVGGAPLASELSRAAMEGIACAACHQTTHAASDREGNPTWRSITTGLELFARPESLAGTPGIGNSGYHLEPSSFLTLARTEAPHGSPSASTRAYLRTSEFCGACHDVRLFGTDVLGVRDRGEHFKRLRDAYSEWRAWSVDRRRHGEAAPTCQGCHMSTYPGVCVAGGNGGSGCPRGTHFEPREPDERASGRVAISSGGETRVASHLFTSVDLPLADEFDDAFASDGALDPSGVPLGLSARREMLLARTFDFAIEGARVSGDRLSIPITLENVGAGHRVPAGFSQEREIWVELTVRDARGALVYEVGKIDRDDEDLRDKIFTRISTSDGNVDGRGRPQGLFGADVIDGPDVPRWSSSPSSGATQFRGRGLVNLQNGFLRCVRCIGTIDASGRCEATGGQGATRADRYADGDYDLDTGECRSNLFGSEALFETYFPIGALDADRGVAKGPDAIISTRSAAPGVRLTYDYELDARGFEPPFDVRARLRFRPFPPYLVRSFAAYEAEMDARGARPRGPQVASRMLARLAIVEVARAEVVVR